MKKGFSLLEIVIVLTILTIISFIVVTVFSSFNSAQGLEKDTQSIMAYLDEAKSKTLSSRDASQHGVHFASTTVTLFRGSVYNPADAENRIFNLNSTVVIRGTALTGGGSDVVFNRLTGETSQYGTITVFSNRASTTRTVTIYKTGSVESN